MEQVITNEAKPEVASLGKIEDFIIHTMPKRFINSKEKSDGSHKNVGLLVFGIGALILVLGIVFVYFYVIKEKNVPAVVTSDVKEVANNPVEEVKEAEVTSTSTVAVELATIATSSIIQNTISDQDVATVTASEVVENVEVATTTTNIVAVNLDNAQNLTSSKDTDNDGLSDAEELVLLTDSEKMDSDADGYSDLSELKKMYNPAGKGNIEQNPKIKKFINFKKGYNLYYPEAWAISEIESGDSAIFKISDMQFVQVITTENSKGQTLDDWYKEQIQVKEIKNDQRIEKRGWSVIKSQDGLVYYLSNILSNSFFTINYSVGENPSAHYRNIFDLMLNSLELGQ